MATFLGQPLTASFPVVPSRSLVDLLVDPVLHIASICLLPTTYRAIRNPAVPNTTTPTDLVCFWVLALNRILTCLDTLFVLFLDNSASSFLIYFSLTRSLLRYMLHLVALAHAIRRRLVAASGAVLGQYTAMGTLMTLGMVIAAVVAAMVILVSFFYAGVASKAAGDTFLATNPRATVAQLKRVLNANTPMWPSQLWQLHLALGLPMVHMVDVVLNIFFYSVASHIWSQTFLSVRKLTAGRWMALSWPLILSIVLHINFLFLTLLQRTALRSWSLGYVVELGQLTTVLDWYIFYTQTLPMMDGLSVSKVTLPGGKTADSSSSTGAPNKSVAEQDKKERDRSRSRSRSRSRPRTMTMYTKTYAPPTLARTHVGGGGGGGGTGDNSARTSYIDITSPTDFVEQLPMPSPTGSRFATGHSRPGRPPLRRDHHHGNAHHLTIDTHLRPGSSSSHRPRRPSRPRNDQLGVPTSPAPGTYSNIGTELSEQALEALKPTSCSHLAIPVSPRQEHASLYSPTASPTAQAVSSSDCARWHASGASRVRRRSRTAVEVGDEEHAGRGGRDDRTTMMMDPAEDGRGGREERVHQLPQQRHRSQSAGSRYPPGHLPIASQYQQRVRRPSDSSAAAGAGGGGVGLNAGYGRATRHQMPLPPLSPVVERTSPVSPRQRSNGEARGYVLSPGRQGW